MNLNASLEKIFAGRWIAGYYPEDAIARARLFNAKGISTMINFLGEEVEDKASVAWNTNVYIDLINSIRKEHTDSSISLKPTEIGLAISYKTMLSNYLKIVKKAKEKGVYVWLDMEGPQYVDDTIKAYKTAIKYGNTGICIQAYLKRSEKDLKNLIKTKAKIRLVKGAYTIKDGSAFASHREISHNYILLAKTLLKDSNDFMIATHDSRIIELMIKSNRISKKRITYAMLNGIRNKYAKYLAKHGQKVSVYVPFGRDWIGFSYRRLIEQKHLMLIIRSLFEKQDL